MSIAFTAFTSHLLLTYSDDHYLLGYHHKGKVCLLVACQMKRMSYNFKNSCITGVPYTFLGAASFKSTKHPTIGDIILFFSSELPDQRLGPCKSLNAN